MLPAYVTGLDPESFDMRDTVFEETAFSDMGFDWAASGRAEDPFADLPGSTVLPGHPVVIDDFDPVEDMLVITLEEDGEAVIETRPTRDRRGTDVLLNGLRVATVTDVAGLTPADIGQILL